MVNAELRDQRLSKQLALGVLSPDGISSSAYGTEEILIELMPLFGVAAFTVILPMTGVILFVMLLVVLSYREVVTVYTRAGGSYVVARENFGPRIAQVAAVVALLIDYVVTVDVQVAAGTRRGRLGVPAPAGPYVTARSRSSVIAILLMCYGNLRGIREAGKIVRAAHLPVPGGGRPDDRRRADPRDPRQPRAAEHPSRRRAVQDTATAPAGCRLRWSIFTLLKSFANGGSSLTGIEAVSNAVSALQPAGGPQRPQGARDRGHHPRHPGRRDLLAGAPHPRDALHTSGYPTVIAQEANMVFGHAGHIMFFVVQAATAADPVHRRQHQLQRLPVPDQLRRRGLVPAAVDDQARPPAGVLQRDHRADRGVGGADAGRRLERGRLVPFYAIGVFTAFTMAGFGMARYHTRARGARLAAQAGDQLHRRRATRVIVVVIFAVVKFTEGAWLIVIIFPILVFALIRLNREYRAEASVLETHREPPAPPACPRASRTTPAGW